MINQYKDKYLLGVDTGSSKTHALIAKSNGDAIGFGEAGCGNYEVVGYELFREAIEESTNQALMMAKTQKEEISAMGFAISGYDWPSEEPLMRKAIKSLGIDCQYKFVNDVTIGLIAGAEDGWGLAVDAGTGNNVRGRDKAGNIGRITGNSVYSGEIGGGGEIVWLAQIAVTHAWTLRGPKTDLTQAMISFTGVKTEFELIEGLCTNQINIPPFFAEEVFRLASEGDNVARNVIKTAAIELAINTNAVIEQLELAREKFDVVLIGSVFKAGEIYLQPFRQTIHTIAPNASFIHLAVPPVIGSVLLAAEILSIPVNNLKSNLVESFKKRFPEHFLDIDLD